MKPNSRRRFFHKAGVGFATLTLGTWTRQKSSFRPAPALYFTNGFKMAEVSSHSVLIWTRLCGQEKPVPVRHERVETVFRHPIGFDENQPVDNMDGAVKGATGRVRATLRQGTHTRRSGWQAATADGDFTVRFAFDNLRASATYQLTLEAQTSESGALVTTTGTFRTAPESQTVMPVRLTTSTCQYFWSFDEPQRGFRTYDSMARLKPDFFIHTGDYIYYDKPGPLAKNAEKARHKWHAMNGWPSLRDFFRHTPLYMLKDDHDLLSDDVNPATPAYGDLTAQEGLKIWHENVALRDKPYRSLRWGKDLEIWLVEGREYRSANKLPDSNEKTIWGKEQKEWFEKTVRASDATFKLLFSPTPVVGPDRDKKIDNHANASFETEGNWLRGFLSQQKNMYVVNGDRHWQYVSVDPKTGVTEFGSGPVSDFHAQGWPEDDLRPEHRFLRVKGGFLGIQIHRNSGTPVIAFTHYNVEGQKVHEEKREADL